MVHGWNNGLHYATIAKAMNVANYIFIFCDEVTNVDN
jgi:hypothetical protein